MVGNWKSERFAGVSETFQMPKNPGKEIGDIALSRWTARMDEESFQMMVLLKK